MQNINRTSVNPATQEPIGEFKVFSEEMVLDVVQKAKESFKTWKDTDISEREGIIERFSGLLFENKQELAELITKETGKPITESKEEIEEALRTIRWFLTETRKIIQQEDIELGIRNVSAWVRFEPIGVVGLITAWNFPVSIPLWKIVPALLCGNTVVFKPSELSTLCGLKIGKILHKAGLPQGVFNVISGDATTGQHLVSLPVHMISFTGSSKAGKDVASRAGKGLKKVVLELGGSDPFIVFDDAIFEQVLNAALFGRFFNCGQTCTAAKRIFVARNIYDSFVDIFVKRVKGLKIGNPIEKETEIGSMISKEQVERLEVQVQDALDKRAKLRCGGKRLETKGYFYEPTVLTNITDDMAVAKEEVFGPVAVIRSFNSLAEVVQMANNTEYGLGASVWTQDSKKAQEVANTLESGMVWINEFGIPYPQCPQGGIKQSGMGRELSKYGVLEFCNMKTIIDSQDKAVKKSWWFPYQKSLPVKVILYIQNIIRNI